MSPNFALILPVPAWNNSPVKKETANGNSRQSKTNGISMRTEKLRFITGATVNLFIQSAEMAMDYDRKFDWNEFFLCAGAGAFATNPKGIASFSPGLPALRSA